MDETINLIIDYLSDPSLIPSPYFQVLMTLRFIFILISIILLGVSIYIIFNTEWIKYRYTKNLVEFTNFKTYEAGKLFKEWKTIMKRIETGIESEYKLAIIEADTMTGDILKRMGMTESTIEEKLNNLSITDIPNLEELKEARKIRNNVVHDPDYELSQEKAKEILSVYEKTFQDLKIIS